MNQSKMINGYDLPITGLGSWRFYSLHIPALICIIISLMTNIFVLYKMNGNTKISKFFNWLKGERFLLYMTVSDLLFNACHSLDHLQIIIVKDHVHPKALCTFYGFVLTVFISAQVLLSNILAINAFFLLYYQKSFFFGLYDYRLLLLVYGLPLIGGTFAVSFDQFGPAGAFCYWDGVNGKIGNMLLAAIPLFIVLCVNIILYILIWYRIHCTEPMIARQEGNDIKLISRSNAAAKKMRLFVLCFFIQWSVPAIYGIWDLIENAPVIFLYIGSILPNIGGILNLVIYYYIQRTKDKNVCNKRKISVYIYAQSNTSC